MEIDQLNDEPEQRFQFSLRTLMFVVTAVCLLTDSCVGIVKWGDALVLKIERDAPRQRALETGTDSDYDRRLLGDEVESLKDQYRASKKS